MGWQFQIWLYLLFVLKYFRRPRYQVSVYRTISPLFSVYIKVGCEGVCKKIHKLELKNK